MAIGDHWEWRGFGSLPPDLRGRIESLHLKFPWPQAIADEYLWLPGIRVNIKIRREGALEVLKFKRFLEASGGLERWLEDAAETHAFPLGPEVVAKLLADLGIEHRGPAGAVPDAAGALTVLRRLAPRAERVVVEKERWQREWAGASPGGERRGVIVEVAEVLSPERIGSVAIEDGAREAVEAARSALGLPGGLRTLGYLDAIAIWARGGRIGSRP